MTEGRYHYQVVEMRKVLDSLQTMYARNKFCTKWGMSLEPPRIRLLIQQIQLLRLPLTAWPWSRTRGRQNSIPTTPRSPIFILRFTTPQWLTSTASQATARSSSVRISIGKQHPMGLLLSICKQTRASCTNQVARFTDRYYKMKIFHTNFQNAERSYLPRTSGRLFALSWPTLFVAPIPS